ncbi:MAG TPA: Holliday junction branch migration protein RuvA [Bacillota bacterium]|nr:Holliday junction branch migration protein RuvA [Bacillota bacterium]
MIGFLRGRLEAREPGAVVLDVGGVGYEVAVSAPTAASLGAPGAEVRLRTRLIVREDALLLYGFADRAEMEVFDLLTAITGIGPKLALAVLSVLPPQRLARAVADEDVTAITAVPGVGKKTAQRIVLELRDKLSSGGPQAPVPSPAAGDEAAAQAVAALVGLGFSQPEAARAVASIAEPPSDPAELVRQALRAAGAGH